MHWRSGGTVQETCRRGRRDSVPAGPGLVLVPVPVLVLLLDVTWVFDSLIDVMQ